jgi:hypothetical protein
VRNTQSHTGRFLARHLNGPSSASLNGKLNGKFASNERPQRPANGGLKPVAPSATMNKDPSPRDP